MKRQLAPFNLFSRRIISFYKVFFRSLIKIHFYVRRETWETDGGLCCEPKNCTESSSLLPFITFLHSQNPATNITAIGKKNCHLYTHIFMSRLLLKMNRWGTSVMETNKSSATNKIEKQRKAMWADDENKLRKKKLSFLRNLMEF